ncbi:hypothetical protein [Psychrobacillus vulpis]|uniref:Uncharacterized protein n=1 Tax=Psychrobacillus vulpis TaxID=2325572 RepID=A0A544TWI2_9BACI|nr:hypothetical protein [Psychrobacillus vulpis]TQR21818.1 hypothetical protein FG384_02410 [Psychrobacillus vulpis]
MKYYYEFNENEYYALVVVTVEGIEPGVKPPYKQATEIYVEIVGGESVESVLEEAHPNLRTKEYAFTKVMRDPTIAEQTLKEAIKEFDSIDNGVLLIDASLL